MVCPAVRPALMPLPCPFLEFGQPQPRDLSAHTGSCELQECLQAVVPHQIGLVCAIMPNIQRAMADRHLRDFNDFHFGIAIARKV